MQKILFRFVKQAVSVARKLTDCAVMQISHPAGNGIAGWKHAVLHVLRLHMEATLVEVRDWAEEMERARTQPKRIGLIIPVVGSRSDSDRFDPVRTR